MRRLAPNSLLGDLDRIFTDAWRDFGAPAARIAPASFTPRIDVRESDEGFRIDAELPGLEQSEIEVGLHDGVLTIKGEHKREEETEGDEGYRHVESFRGGFNRALRLPEEIDADAVTAAYKNGVLSVTVPKLPEAKPEVRTIPVTAG